MSQGDSSVPRFAARPSGATYQSAPSAPRHESNSHPQTTGLHTLIELASIDSLSGGFLLLAPPLQDYHFFSNAAEQPYWQ